MKILFLATWFPHPLDNGSKIRVFHLLRALAASHEVTLLAFAFDTADVAGARALNDLCQTVHTVPRNPFQRSAWRERTRFLSFSPIVTQPVPEMVAALGELSATQRFDLVIASTEIMAAYALMAPAGTVRVLEEHNAMGRWAWERYLGQTTLLDRLRCWMSWTKGRIYERRLFSCFDLISMVSEQDRQYCAKTFPAYTGRVAVVPNGVDCTYNRPGMAVPVACSLVFNGALSYDINYDAMRFFLADIWPTIRREVPETTLTITGSTSGVDLSGLTLDNHVRLTGLVDDVRPYVAEAWAGVVPIREGGGTRLKVLEALALGTPVVATAKAVEGHDLTAEQHYLAADSAEAFAQQTNRLLRDHDLRAHLSIAGRRVVETRYDWEKLGQRFVALCEGVMDRGSNR